MVDIVHYFHTTLADLNVRDVCVCVCVCFKCVKLRYSCGVGR